MRCPGGRGKRDNFDTRQDLPGLAQNEHIMFCVKTPPRREKAVKKGLLTMKMSDEAIKETIIGEESLFEGRLVKVHKLDVTLPGGKPALREVVRHPGASAVVPVDDEGMVTMVKQFRAAVGKVLLEIPAGKLDYKGEDRLEAARRELREETGLTAANWVHLADITTTPGFCDELISLYLATGLTSGETDPDEDEFLNVVKVPLDELIAMAVRGEIGDSKTLIGLLLAEKRLRGEAEHGA